MIARGRGGQDAEALRSPAKILPSLPGALHIARTGLDYVIGRVIVRPAATVARSSLSPTAQRARWPGMHRSDAGEQGGAPGEHRHRH